MNRALHIASHLSNNEEGRNSGVCSHNNNNNNATSTPHHLLYQRLQEAQEEKLRRGEGICSRVDCWVHSDTGMGLLRFHPHATAHLPPPPPRDDPYPQRLASSSSSCTSFPPSISTASSSSSLYSQNGGIGACNLFSLLPRRCWFSIPPAFEPVALQEEAVVEEAEEKEKSTVMKCSLHGGNDHPSTSTPIPCETSTTTSTAPCPCSSSSPPPESPGSLSAAQRRAILRGLHTLQQDPRCSYITLTSCTPHIFSLGINTCDFSDGVLKKPTVEELCQAIVQCTKPTIAAILGPCFSWGLEMALCATYRVGGGGGGRTRTAAILSFPEARMAIIPASLTGIQAVVQRAGVPAAVRLLCSGVMLSASMAEREYHLLDAVWSWGEAGDRERREGGKIIPAPRSSGEQSTEEVNAVAGGRSSGRMGVGDKASWRRSRREKEKSLKEALEQEEKLFIPSPVCCSSPSLVSPGHNDNHRHHSGRITSREEKRREMKAVEVWWGRWLEMLAHFASDKKIGRPPRHPFTCSSTSGVVVVGFGGRERRESGPAPGVSASSLVSSCCPFPDPVTSSLIPHHPNARRRVWRSLQEWARARLCCAWAVHQISILPEMAGRWKSPYCMVESIRMATIWFTLPTRGNNPEQQKNENAKAPAAVAAAEHWRRHKNHFLKYLATLPETKGVQHVYKCIHVVNDRVEARAAAALMMMAAEERKGVESLLKASREEEGRRETPSAASLTLSIPAPSSSSLSSCFAIRQVSMVAEDLGRAAFIAAMILHSQPQISILVLCLRPGASLPYRPATTTSPIEDDAHTSSYFYPPQDCPCSCHEDPPPLAVPSDGEEGGRRENSDDVPNTKTTTKVCPLCHHSNPAPASLSTSSATTSRRATITRMSRAEHSFPSRKINPFDREENQKQFIRVKAFYHSVLDHLRLFQCLSLSEREESEKENPPPPTTPTLVGAVLGNGGAAFPIGGTTRQPQQGKRAAYPSGGCSNKSSEDYHHHHYQSNNTNANANNHEDDVDEHNSFTSSSSSPTPPHVSHTLMRVLRDRVDAQLRLIDSQGMVVEVMSPVEEEEEENNNNDNDGEGAYHYHPRHQQMIQNDVGRQWRWEGVPASFYQSDLLIECSYPYSSSSSSSSSFSSSNDGPGFSSSSSRSCGDGGEGRERGGSPHSNSLHHYYKGSGGGGTRQEQYFSYFDHAFSPSCIFLTTTAMTNVKSLSMLVPHHANRVLGVFFPPRVHTHAGIAEVNPTTSTDPMVLAVVASFLRHLQCYPVVVRPPICGAVTCRLFFTALRQAQECVIAGCFPIEVDRAMRRRTACRIGPLALEDMWGLDWCAAVRKVMRNDDRRIESAFSRGIGHWARPLPSSFAASRSTPPVVKTGLPRCDALVKELTSNGAVGWRTGRGWFDYDPYLGREFFFPYGGAGGKEGVERYLKTATNSPSDVSLLYQAIFHHPPPPCSSPFLPSPFHPLGMNKRLARWLYPSNEKGLCYSSSSFSSSGRGDVRTRSISTNTMDHHPTSPFQSPEEEDTNEHQRPFFPNIFDLVPPLYVLDPHRVAKHSRKPELAALQFCSRAGLFRRDVTEVEMSERYCFAMTQEAVRLLSDGLVSCSEDIDLISVYALAFPSWTGGVLFESSKMANPKSLFNKIRVYMFALGEDVFPPPCRAILEMAESNTSIHERFSAK